MLDILGGQDLGQVLLQRAELSAASVSSASVSSISYASMDPSAAFCKISRSSTRIVPASDRRTNSAAISPLKFCAPVGTPPPGSRPDRVHRPRCLPYRPCHLLIFASTPAQSQCRTERTPAASRRSDDLSSRVDKRPRVHLGRSTTGGWSLRSGGCRRRHSVASWWMTRPRVCRGGMRSLSLPMRPSSCLPSTRRSVAVQAVATCPCADVGGRPMLRALARLSEARDGEIRKRKGEHK